MTYTPQQLKDWKAYEKVRLSGRWNMLMPQAQDASKLDKDSYFFVLTHYSAMALIVKEAK